MYGGMEDNDVKRLIQLEDENVKLKKLSAEKPYKTEIPDIKKDTLSV